MKRKQNITAGALCAALTCAAGGAAADTLSLQVDGRTYLIELHSTPEAGLLKQVLPLQLQFENFGNKERIAYLPQKLAISSWKKPAEVRRGALAYYVPWGNLCVFRVDYHSPDDLIVLGQLSEEAVQAVERSDQAVLALP